MKKFFVLLLAVVLACAGSEAWAVEYGAEGYETEGYDEAHAWEISSASTFVKVRADLVDEKISAGSYFKLTSDIDMTGYNNFALNIKKGENLTFDGGNHTVTIRIVVAGLEYLDYYRDYSSVGLFGTMYGGTIKNLCVSGSITASAKHTYHYDRDGNESYMAGDVLAGGVVGKIYGGTIDNCKFDGTITVTNTSEYGGGSTFAGGIAGFVNDIEDAVKIINCKVGSVSPTTISASAGEFDSCAGGIAGYFQDNDSESRLTGNEVRAVLKYAVSQGWLFGLRSGNTGTVENNTEASPIQEQEQETGNDDSNNQSQDNNGQDDTTDIDNTTDNTKTQTGGSSGGSSGGGGCNSGFGLLGLMLAVTLLRRSNR